MKDYNYIYDCILIEDYSILPGHQYHLYLYPLFLCQYFNYSFILFYLYLSYYLYFHLYCYAIFSFYFAIILRIPLKVILN